MFKVAKLNFVGNERLNIQLLKQDRTSYQDGKKISFDNYKTLSFTISGDDYSFSFDLGCRLEKLLEIPINETINFKKWILNGSTEFNVKGVTIINPQFEIKANRYLENKFIINLTFNTEDYAGIIEFSFDLDNYN